MKIVMTLLVRDEQDIIRENIEFHLSQGVDYFIATDNKSVDSTPDILKEYEKKGLLRYIFEGDDNYDQHAWVTRMAQMAYTEYSADWVINNDADEFWWPRTGTLESTFHKINKEYNIVVANRYNFVAVDDVDTPFYQSMIYREKVSLNPLGRPLPPTVAHRGSESVIVQQGNHSVTGIENPKIIDDLIEILHFPIRNYLQLENKITKGGAAYERNTELPTPIGCTWRALYKEYQKNNNLHDYYQNNFYNAKRLKKELKSGSIVVDKRLSRYFLEKNLDHKIKATKKTHTTITISSLIASIKSYIFN